MQVTCNLSAMATADVKDKAGPTIPMDAAAVFGAAVQLPTFDRSEPEAWFALADANFGLRGVTDSKIKYWYVLSKFDSAALKKLSTFLKRPRGADPYRELREKLCQTYEPPIEQKLDTFLSLAEMSDERPVEFGLDIQRLTSEAHHGQRPQTSFFEMLATNHYHGNHRQPVRIFRGGYVGCRQGLDGRGSGSDNGAAGNCHSSVWPSGSRCTGIVSRRKTGWTTMRRPCNGGVRLPQ